MKKTRKRPETGVLILSSDTRLESGEHHVDAINAQGVPVRVCRVKCLPGTHPFTADSANAGEKE